MNNQQVQYYKDAFPKGTRIMLDSMGDDPRPIPPGTTGTVIAVDDIGTIHCAFDNGRQLGICPDVDSFHAIDSVESEEPVMSM